MGDIFVSILLGFLFTVFYELPLIKMESYLFKRRHNGNILFDCQYIPLFFSFSAIKPVKPFMVPNTKQK